MKKALFFDTMLTPKIITFVYWLFLLFALIGGLGAMFGNYGGFSFGSFLMGLAVMVGGAVGARIWCELLIILFKINDNIKALAENQS